MGVLVIGLGAWMLWLQRDLLALAMGEPAAAPVAQTALGGTAGHADQPEPRHQHAHSHDHHHRHEHAHSVAASHQQAHGDDLGWHSHGWGTYHSHRIDLVTDNRPKIAVLLALGVVGGILPDPAALAILMAALASGKVMLGLLTVVVFSLGFAATLVAVGVIAAKVGEKVLEWLSSIWVVRVQIGTTLLILGMGVVLTVRAAYQVAALPG
jgi:nickel/cobalt transporter (NicO) family protein